MNTLRSRLRSRREQGDNDRAESPPSTPDPVQPVLTVPGELVVGLQGARGALDAIQIDGSGQVRVFGTWTGDDPDIDASVDGRTIPRDSVQRVYRPDVAGPGGGLFTGFVAIFGPTEADRAVLGLSVRLGEVMHTTTVDWQSEEPHYSTLLTTGHVIGRDQIYGTGPPVGTAAADAVALARSVATGKTLDFGCGPGPLVRVLRADGIDAYGIEVFRDDLVVEDDLQPFIHRYDGRLPTGLPSEAFDSSTCFEVLEHIPDPEPAVAELARLTRVRCAVTVPDASSIPLLYRHRVVPWHLLESSHVNFFTPHSLRAMLLRHFSQVELVGIGAMRVNDTNCFMSVGAICRK